MQVGTLEARHFVLLGPAVLCVCVPCYMLGAAALHCAGGTA